MAHPDQSESHETYGAFTEREPDCLFALLAGEALSRSGTGVMGARWRYAGRTNDCHVWRGTCGWCGRRATVRAGDEEASSVQSEIETFGGLECRACSDDRMHEFDHIARAASEAEHARIVRDVPLAGTFRGTKHERAYRAWCNRRSLAPLPPWPAGLRLPPLAQPSAVSTSDPSGPLSNAGLPPLANAPPA